MACAYQHYYRDEIKIARKFLGLGTYGFALDFGGTLLKVAYIEASQKHEDPVTVKLISFPSRNLDDCLSFIKENLTLGQGKKYEKFFSNSCGVTMLMHRHKIHETLGFELNDTHEFECFAKGLKFGLENLPADDFISYTGYCSEKYFPKPAPPSEQLLGMVMMSIKSNAGRKQAAENPPPQYPCLVCFAGSAFAMELVNEDGSIENVMPNNRGGMMFYGLGRLLTGCQNYEELLELALKGDTANISMSVKDFPADALKQGDMDFTDVLMDDLFTNVGLPYSKIIRDDIKNPKKEDVANTLLHTMCADLVQQCLHIARRKNVQRVYLCGSFCKNNPLLKEYVKRCDLMELGLEGPLVVMSILKYESYIGAIGNIIRAGETFTEK